MTKPERGPGKGEGDGEKKRRRMDGEGVGCMKESELDEVQVY